MTVWVLGSINSDVKLAVPHVVRPGETILAAEQGRQVGGKGANQAIAAASLGSTVRLLGAVGDDDEGGAALAHLRACGVDVSGVEVTQARTGTATIQLTPEGQNAIVVAPGANALLSAALVSHQLAALKSDDALISQLEIPAERVADGLRRARALGALTILNASPAGQVRRELLELVDVLVVNEIEGEALTGHAEAAAGTPDELHSLAALGPRTVVQTLGPRGAAWRTVEGTFGLAAAHPVPAVVDTTGAGDAFLGALTAALLTGADLAAACEAGNAAAARCVQVVGPLTR